MIVSASPKWLKLNILFQLCYSKLNHKTVSVGVDVQVRLITQ